MINKTKRKDFEFQMLSSSRWFNIFIYFDSYSFFSNIFNISDGTMVLVEKLFSR